MHRYTALHRSFHLPVAEKVPSFALRSPSVTTARTIPSGAAIVRPREGLPLRMEQRLHLALS